MAEAHLERLTDSRMKLPEWELPSDYENGSQEKSHYRAAISKPSRFSIFEKLDHLMPPQKWYLGLSRRTFLLACNFLLVVIIILAVALPLALRKHSRYQPKGPALPSSSLTMSLPKPGPSPSIQFANLSRRPDVLCSRTWCLRHHILR